MELINKLDFIKKSINNISKQYRFRLAMVLLTGTVMMILLLLNDLFILDIIYPVRDAVFGYLGIEAASHAALNEVVLIAIQMVLYLISMLLPIIIPAAVYIKTSPVKYKNNKGVAALIPFIMGSSYVVSIIASALFSAFGDRFSNSMLESLPTTIPGITLYVIFISLLPGIFEELAFRGVMLRILSPYGKWQAIIISAAVFGCMHVNPPQALFAFAFGVLAGWLYTKTGTLLWGMLIHISVNGLSAITSIVYTYYFPNGIAQLAVLEVIIVGLIIYAVVYGIVLLSRYIGKSSSFTPQKIPSAKTVTPTDSLANLFKGFCAPALAMFLAMLITLLLTRYFPETVSKILQMIK